jgi:hypothetical protein
MAYAAVVNFLGNNVDRINKNTETLIEVCLEIKKKSVTISPQANYTNSDRLSRRS